MPSEPSCKKCKRDELFQLSHLPGHRSTKYILHDESVRMVVGVLRTRMQHSNEGKRRSCSYYCRWSLVDWNHQLSLWYHKLVASLGSVRQYALRGFSYRASAQQQGEDGCHEATFSQSTARAREKVEWHTTEQQKGRVRCSCTVEQRRMARAEKVLEDPPYTVIAQKCWCRPSYCPCRKRRIKHSFL